MKPAKFITGLIIFQSLIIISGLLSAQDLSKKISVTLKNVKLAEAIRVIGEEGGIYFSYSPQTIPAEKLVSVKARNKSVREVLDGLLTPNGIEYQIIENQVILKASKVKPPEVKTDIPPVKEKTVKRFTLSGTLKDKESGEVLIGAYAYAKGTTLGAVSNSYGFYSLTLPEGAYTLVFSFIGYQPVEQVLEVTADMNLSPELTATKTEVRPVEITAKDEENPLNGKQVGIQKLQPKWLSQLPGIAGDIDIIKSLQAIPGIQSYSDGSAMFFVRGGQSDQNQVLVDEAPIYNSAHLFGFVSALAPEAISDVTIYKGDAPANYGGRLSSVVDIRTRDGNMKRFGMAGNIGVLVSDLALEGPFKKDVASWFVSGRFSNLNWIFSRQLKNSTLKMNFYDFNTKLNFKLSPKDRLYFTFYSGHDNFSRELAAGRSFSISWGNLLGTIRWSHIYGDRLFSNTTAYFSRYEYNLFLVKETGNRWLSAISHLSLKSDYTWYINPSNTFRAGIEISPQQSNPGNVELSDENLQSLLPYTGEYNFGEYILYACNEQGLGEKLRLDYGLRLSLFQNYGKGEVYIFDEQHFVTDTLYPEENRSYQTYFSPEPRLSMTYTPVTTVALRLAYARHSQFKQLLNNSSSPFTSLESWVPAGPNIRPQTADQISLGYAQKLFKSRFVLTAEAYYKHFHHSVDYADHSNILFNPLLEGELRFGKAWSYGAEVMFRKENGKLTGWIAYTWSRAMRQISGINNGDTYPAAWDIPHDVNISLAYDTYKRWSFVANFIFHTGAPVTTPTAFYYYNGASVPYYASRNNDRLPDYHRLDLSVVFKLSKPERRYQHSLSLNIYNVYNRKNPFSVNFNKFTGDNGKLLVPADHGSAYELTPTTISAAGIIPSLNYKFRF